MLGRGKGLCLGKEEEEEEPLLAGKEKENRASPAGLLPLSVMALSLVSLPATLQCALPVEKSL